MNKRDRLPVAALKNEVTDNGVKFRKSVLPNGIRVLSEEVPGVSSFALGICVDIGSRNDPKGYEGLAHFIEHALFLGTRKRSSAKIASDFELEGAYTNAFTTKELTCYYVRALTGHFKKTFEILADVALNPAFNERKTLIEKGVIREEIKSYDDEPEEYIYDLADEVIFGKHPLARPIAGNLKSVDKIDAKILKEYHEENYTPENILISVAGNIPHEKVVELAGAYFGNLTSGKKRKALRKPKWLEAARKDVVKNLQQSHLLLARQIPGINSPDRFPLAILNIILGDGLSSRLHRSLREMNGLAYNIYSSIQMMIDSGMFYIYAGTEVNKLTKAEKLIFKEFDKLINERITKAEIKRAKEQIKSNTIMALESMNTRMNSMAKSEFNLGYYEDIPSTIKAIDEIGMEDIRNCAIKFLIGDDWNVITLSAKQ